MNRFDPKEIDPLRFCKMTQVWEVNADLSEFPRLLPELAQGQLHCRVTGRTDKHYGCVLRLEISGEVETTCQRCLGRLAHEVAIDSEISLARDEAELERREADSEAGMDTILMSAKLSLIELIEDEVLLGLPLAPMHAPGVCVIPTVII
ncbi:MAG: YceD family protein [Thiobacillus sp.]